MCFIYQREKNHESVNWIIKYMIISYLNIQFLLNIKTISKRKHLEKAKRPTILAFSYSANKFESSAISHEKIKKQNRLDQTPAKSTKENTQFTFSLIGILRYGEMFKIKQKFMSSLLSFEKIQSKAIQWMCLS